MAAENRSSSIDQCILDIVECPICNEELQDNRCLPCLHMFCLKCLESYRKGKPKGKPLPCPVCRRPFSTSKSLSDLPRNFFIAKLLDAHKLKNQDALPKICEICSEGTCKRPFTYMEGEDTNVVLATRFCCDCRQFLCVACEKQHKKIKAITWHQIIDSTSVTDSQELTPRPTYCIVHKTKEAELYCEDCKTVICWQCKAQSHHSHASLEASSATKQLTATLEDHIEKISKYLLAKEDVILKLAQHEKSYTDDIEAETAKICKEQRRLHRCINENGDKLKHVLRTSTTVHLNEYKALRKKLKTDVAELNKHKTYIEQIIHMGNVSDLCEYTNALISKTDRLTEEFSCSIIVPTFAHLSGSDLEDLLTGKRTDINLQYMDKADKGNDNKVYLQDDLTQTIDSKESPKDQDSTYMYCIDNTDNSNDSRNRLQDEKLPADQLPESCKDEDSSTVKDWSLMKAITLEKDLTITGTTVLDSTLYVVSQDSNNISVYSASEFIFLKNIIVDGLTSANDIVSCKCNHCLYVCDWGSMRIFRVKVREDMQQMHWSTGKDLGCLSVTNEHTILTAGYISRKLKEYTSEGELIRSIELGDDLKPWHAIKLGGSNPHYLVCQGEKYFHTFHRVCLLDLNGEIRNVFGDKAGSDKEHLCGPYHLAVDKSGCILVNDCNNSRILLLGPDLKFMKEIIPSSLNVLRRARRMYLDEVAGRLYVADNPRTDSGTKDGRILVFSCAGGISV